MRRAILIVGIGLAVFLVAALVGFVVAARIAPERLQAEAERMLSDLTEAQVTLGTVHLAFAEELPWMQLQAHDARIDWPNGGSLTAGRLDGDLNPISLAVARLQVRNLALTDVHWVMPDWWREDEREAPADPGEPRPIGTAAVIDWFDRQGSALHERPCLGPDIEFTRFDISQTRGDAVEPLLRGGQGSMHCLALGTGAEADLRGTLVLAAQEAPVHLEIRATDSEVALILSSDEAPIEGWARALDFETELQGRLGGILRWRMPEGGPQHLEANLRGTGIRGPVGRPGNPAAALELDRPRLRASLTGTQHQLKVRFAELADSGVAVRGDAAFVLPVQHDAAIRARVEATDLSLENIHHLVAQLSDPMRETTEEILARVEAGTVDRVEIALQSTARGFDSITGRGPLTRPGDLRTTLEFRDGVIRAGESDRMREVAGRIHFDGQRLEISDASASFGERRLEKLDAALVGLDHLEDPDQIRCRRPAHVAALPGLDSFSDWRSSRREGDTTPTWRKLRLELEHTAHPILLCAVSDVVAEIVPDANGLDFHIERGAWAGLPIGAEATYRETPAGEVVVLAATVGEPLPPPVVGHDADRTPGEWGRGRFELEANRLGRFRIRGAEGDLSVVGTEVTLTDTVLRLDPGGAIEGHAEIELGEEGDPVYSAGLEFADVSLEDLWTAADLEAGLLSGHLHGALVAEGPLVPNENPLANATGAVAFHAREGDIHRRVPFLLAIVLASKRFQPFKNRDRIAYQAIDLSGTLEGGVLNVGNLTLTSSDVRAAASGTLDLDSDAELDMALGVFFFPTLDGVIQKIPILNRIFLGRNDNLVGAYFAVDGPISGPKARIVARDSLTQGGAAGMVLAVPAFVLGGFQEIRSMVTPSQPAPAEPGTPQDS